MRPPKRVDVMGCPVDSLTLDETVAEVERIVDRGTPTQHMAINAAKFVAMQRNRELRAAVFGSGLINADGASIVWASRWLGNPLPERVAGCDLFEALLAAAPSRGWRVYLLGARPKTLKRVVETAKERYPGIEIAGARDGYFTPAEEPGVAEAIRASHAQLLFVGISSPKKETFLARWLTTMDVPLAMGVGGSFEILAGTLTRAPRLVRRAGLEWAWRTALEPRRMWRRGIVDSLRFTARVAQARTVGYRLPTET